MKTIQDIRKANNPERYSLIEDNLEYILQIKDSDYMILTVSKNNKRAKSKAWTLFDDYIDEFCFNNEGEIEYGQLDIEKAFVNYVNNHHNGVKICIK